MPLHAIQKLPVRKTSAALWDKQNNYSQNSANIPGNVSIQIANAEAITGYFHWWKNWFCKRNAPNDSWWRYSSKPNMVLGRSTLLLPGFVNKLNWQIWGFEKPLCGCSTIIVCKRKYCIGSFIQQRHYWNPFWDSPYVEILREFVAIHNALEDVPETSWFMQEDARSHQTSAIFTLLEEYFENRMIALDYLKVTGKVMNWSHFSPDLNPCDFFFGVIWRMWFAAKNPHS